ncbi:transglutaminase-like domain-containing protein [Comamonas sp.]|uniref:transglutaminase-like domain-containing protein n=1 Tax=Comamonas sp. TaxID=34028 RepID=UPI0028ABF497|nr:transglutaminase-like domain-containing protein [Comamonas sp.]
MAIVNANSQMAAAAGDEATEAVMRGFKKIVRPVAHVVAAAHIALALQPLSAIAQEKAEQTYSPLAQSQMQRLHDWDAKLKAANYQAQKNDQAGPQRLQYLIQQASEQTQDLLVQQSLVLPQQKKAGPAPIYNAKTTPASLRDTLAAIQDESGTAREDLQNMRAELVHKGLSAEMLARHDAAVAEFEQRVQRLDALAARLVGNNGGLAAKSAASINSADLQALGALLAQGAPQKKIITSPELPWRNPTPTKREPAQTRQAWSEQLGLPAGQAALQSAPVTKVTTVGGVQFTVPPSADQAPNDADLGETDEIVLTDAIKAKAAELGKNPVAIQNWVRNHIEWVPTWGAIQTADTVLGSGRGNAFDIASLTIALLRASNIPARYQLGTIELPVAQTMNWVGGAQVPAAAQQLLAQGGIANTGIIMNGKIASIRMEHIWASAYVNYAASKGAIDGGADASPPQHPNINAHANGWLPLDASYKQYQYAPGMNLQQAVPLDAKALLDSAQLGATVNEAEGWVQNLNQAAVQNQMQQYQAQLQSYINSQNAGATVGDVIGKKIIAERMPATLSGQLPYTVVTENPATSRIPASLQHQFQYSLTDQWGDQILSYTAKVSQLAGKRITLSYVPADKATEDLIASYLPKPHADGSPIQPSELPTSLPGYLIRLNPQINVNGQVAAQSSMALTMGTELQGQGGFTQYSNPSQWDLTPDASHVVGQATAIGVSAGGISTKQLDVLKARLETTKSHIQANSVAALTGEQISGDLLTAVIWSWFAAAEGQNRLSQSQAGVIETPGLSYGLFHAIAEPVYSWGVVRQVRFPGVNLDIGHIRNLTWAKDNDQSKWVSYNRMRGQYMSALEHAVPERFFSDSSQCNLAGTTTPVTGLPECAQGISAVKAIGLATAQGQKIYTITSKVYQNSPNIVNEALTAHSQETKNRVQSALTAGMEVTIHQTPIMEGGWKGAGFISIEPQTGAGAYTIEGGSNGGILLAIAYIFAVLINTIIILPAIAFFLTIIAVIFTPFIAAALLLIASAAALWISAEMNLKDYPCAQAIFQGIAGAMLGLLWGGSAAMSLRNAISVLVGGGVMGAPGVVKTCLQS